MLPLDITLVLLDIPQGAITVGSAILVAIVGAFLALGGWVLRLLFSIQGRLTVLETKLAPLEPEKVMETNARMAILWELFRASIPNLGTLESPRNPMKQERWDELTFKLHKDELSDDEAEEFLAALLKREEQAREEKDVPALAILGPGIILTKWQLKEKELREQK